MSIYNKIRIIFLVSFLFLTAFFASTFYIERSVHKQEIEKRYFRTALFLQKHFRQSMHRDRSVNFSDDTVKLYLKESALKRVTGEKMSRVLNQARVVKKRKVLRANLQILRLKDKRYLSFKNHRFHILLQDKEKQQPPYALLLGYVGALLFLLSLYFWLTRSLKPLKTLQEKIEEVSDGDLSVSFKSDKRDEIAQVSNAFDDALRKLESLIDSRQLFLRAIMHELKTPIGKGKILNSFLHEEKLQDGYEEVFQRLELLLNEFAKIEQMLSANYEVKMVKYNAQDLVEQALELMLLDEDTLENSVTIVENTPLVLSTDFTLFPLALKNLIDNAMKYGDEGKVEIVIEKDGISVVSKGLELTDDIEDYFKPFHASSKGMGLGLYIVHNSLEMLHLKLQYHHFKGKNSFKILHSL